MSVSNKAPFSRKRLQTVFEQLANDRKLDILTFAAEHEQFTVSELKEEIEIPHTTAHEYCRDLHAAGLLHREQGKPARYSVVEFDLHLSLEAIADAVETESQTLEYITDTYGEDSIDAVIDIWEEVETGKLTYREASATLGMQHADFLQVAAEMELLSR